MEEANARIEGGYINRVEVVHRVGLLHFCTVHREDRMARTFIDAEYPG